MNFATERDFETYIRNLIFEHVTKLDPSIYVLRNKKAVDIVICKDSSPPQVFFIEVKYHKRSHGRLGFGSGNGGGFQPELISLKPSYFESNLRWALASEEHLGKIFFLPSEVLRRYVSGGNVGEKFNNIRARLFQEQAWMSESQLVAELRRWFGMGPAES